MTATVANAAWFASCLPEYLRFRRATRQVREEQEHILRRILRRNEQTEFGRRHDFARMRTLDDYRRNTPLQDYEQVGRAVDRLAQGEPQLITVEPVKLFEPTSGSSGGSKWIPYTQSLQNEFQRGIQAWVADMFLHDPDLTCGPAYWSVSPASSTLQTTPGGVPVGFADDSEYVGGLRRRLVRAAMAVPPGVRELTDIEEFRYATLRHLIARRDLRFISVWSPSFLTLLVEQLPAFSERLARDVPQQRLALLGSTPADCHARLWPHLRMISCWTDGNSAAGSRELGALFPQARIRGKGLIATEGFVSLPWEASGASILAIRSHFLEFLPLGSSEADAERPQLADELEIGQRYSVVLTTGGGLYRYDLGDILEVVGRVARCPLVRFIARRRISDWRGEKLHEAHVARLVSAASEKPAFAPDFTMLACDTEGPVANYVLYVEAAGTDDQLLRFAALVENGLQENFHYRYARRLGQLGAVRVFAARGARASYTMACVARGQRIGDVKISMLDSRDGWTPKFNGRLVPIPADAGRSR